MKKLVPFLILGLVIRLGLMAWTIHSDIRGHNFAAYLIAQKGEIFSFYDHLRLLPRSDPLVRLYHDDLFIYPPLAYLTHALFNKVLYPFYPQNLFNLLILDIGQTAHNPQLPWLLILLKLPYLVADVFCLLIIRKILEPKFQYLGSLLWIFNPVTIYASYMLAQFDIFIALFLLLALSSMKLSPVFIGLAAGFKPFPLFFLPFLPGNKLKNVLMGLLTYLVLLSPYLGSIGFRQYALLASQSDKITYAKIMVSATQYIPLFFVGVVAFFWWNYYKEKSLPAWSWPMSVLLLFYSFSHFHPQWFVWLTPWLIYQTLSGKIYLYWAAILAWLTILLSFDFSLHLASFWWLGLVPNQYLFSGNLLFSNLVLLARAFLIPVSFLL